jgi:antitoxin YefM
MRRPGRINPLRFQAGHDAVLISAEDWQAIQETLYLLSVPGMRESIQQGMAEPVEACAEALDW